MKRFAYVTAATVLAVGMTGAWAADPAEPATGAEDDRPQARDADDTGRNVRDRGDTSGTKPTPMDQSNDPADVKLTADIRRAITEDDSLSTNAHNVKIITNAGRVVLRGPVDSPEERDKVVAKAKQIAGAQRVDNQLEINKE
jgi:osmotically-inducible protein OsmY